MSDLRKKIESRVGRQIYEQCGLRAVQQWHRLPRVVVPIPNTVKTAGEIAGSFDFLLWEDFVAMVSIGDSPWVLFCICRDEKLISGGPSHMQDRMNVMTYGEHISFATFIDNATGELSFDFPDPDLTKEQKVKRMRVARTLIAYMCWVCRYLAQCPEYLVEIQPVLDGKTRRRAAKTAKKKPWLRDDSPRIILLDPTKARQHGHRIDRGGAHASPIPHQRRGNWAILKHEKYGERRGEKIWRRPTWVGDKEWVFRGSRYQVLDVGTKSKGAP